MRTIFVMILFAALSLNPDSSSGETSSHIGIVKSMVGEVVIVRSGHHLNAEPNMKLIVGDIVQTGQNGKTGLILDDDTVISLGHNSSIILNNFIFQPNEKKLSLIARVLQGTVSFLSGQIAKLAPNLVHIETPNATIGVRGTHVLIQVD